MRLEQRGIKVTIVDKTIGYELRCAPPIPIDAEYARDLGYAAVIHLLKGGSSALVTIQGGEFQPIPFAEVLDQGSGKGRRRARRRRRPRATRWRASTWCGSAPGDFADEAWVATLAAAAGHGRGGLPHPLQPH